MPIMTMSGLRSGPIDGDGSSLTHCGLTEPRVLQETTRLHHQCKSTALPFQGTHLKAILHGGVQEGEREKGTVESTPDDCRLCWILFLSLPLSAKPCATTFQLQKSPLSTSLCTCSLICERCTSHLLKVQCMPASEVKPSHLFVITIAVLLVTVVASCWCSCDHHRHTQSYHCTTLTNTLSCIDLLLGTLSRMFARVRVRREGVGWGAHTCALGIFGIGLSCVFPSAENEQILKYAHGSSLHIFLLSFVL